MRILVTNDDGIDAPGLHALAAGIVSLGHDIVVAAPLDDRSGSSAAIGNLGPGGTITTKRVMLPGLPDVEAYGVDGAPALAVLAAQLGGFGPRPELVVSGINPGHNTGRATLHSGTVGAALTASNFGVSGLAVSSGGRRADGNDPEWATATEFAREALGWLLTAPARTVLNLNVPDRPLDEIKGVRWAELAPFGTVRSALVSSGEGQLEMEFRQTDEKLPEDSDSALVTAGYVAVTVLTGIRAGEWAPVAEQLERRVLRPAP